MSEGTTITYAGSEDTETDRFMSEFPGPVSRTPLVILARSPYTTSDGQPEYGNTSIYQAPSGAWVFDAGQFTWSLGLDNVTGDPRLQRITTNLLNAFVAGAPPTAP